MPFRPPTAADVDALVDGLVIPEEFLVGAATCGYQSEGGFNIVDGPRNNWAEWEARPGNERTGAGAGFWARPERDLDLAQAMGLNALRLGIEWARVQPVRERRLLDDPPPWDDDALERYVGILAAARARGLEPVVTLHHFSHPYWAGPDFWLSDTGVDRFVAYVGALVPAVNEKLLARGERPITWWITLNEPNVLAPASYLSRWMPSPMPLDLGSPGRVLRCLDALYAAHIRAYDVIHRWYETKGLARPMVAFNNFALDLYGADRLFVDLVLSRSRGIQVGAALQKDVVERARRYHQSIARLVGRSRVPAPERWLAAHGMRALSPRMFSPERFPKLLDALWTCPRERPLDVVAIDYYDATVANQLRLAAGAYDPWDWEAIPEGLEDVVQANGADGLAVLIAENGMATRRRAGGRAEPRADGLRRDDFIRAHVFHLLRAMKAGVRVAGYLHWSLTDNYEWGRFAPRFGLHGVDYADEARRRLPVDASGVDAAGAFGRIARAIRARDVEALSDALVA